MGAYFKFGNPDCDVTAPWLSSFSLDGELEASVLSVPAPSGEFKTKTKAHAEGSILWK